jgi:hypothetical protein
LEHERQLEHLGIDAVVAREVLTPQHALVRGERRERPARHARGQVGPRVGRRRHLRQRARCEASCAGHQHRARPPRRCLERQAVLGVRRRRPELLAAFERAVTTVAQVDQTVPVTRGAEAADVPGELVEVTQLDELGVHVVVGQTTGHG